MGFLVSSTNQAGSLGALVFASVAALMATSFGCKKKEGAVRGRGQRRPAAITSPS